MKTLIYLDKNSLSPAGGPLGVGYYIYNNIRKNKIENIEFLNFSIKKNEKNKKYKKILYKFPLLTKLVRSFRHIKEYNKMLYHPQYVKGKFDKYDIIHFHRTSDMYKERKNLKEFKGLILITSHSPIPLALELYEACATKFEKKYFKKRYEDFVEMDRWSFLNSSYIVFPCEFAEEPYYNNWEEYNKIHNVKKDSYKYVLTGISQKKAIKNRNYVRNKYNITENDFVISYVGRHNSVKGYDNLKTIGEKILKDKNIKFLIAGREGPISKLDNDSWIEVGFTKDPYSIISASDVFVLPNKETYFDLVMLEVLSLGKIVVASRTGGNKYFEEKKVKGVFLYDTIDEAICIINSIKKMPKNKIKYLEKENSKFYKENLTDDVFFKNYNKMLNDIF